MGTSANVKGAENAAETFLNTPALQEKAEENGIDAVIDAFDADITKQELKQGIRALTIEQVTGDDTVDETDATDKNLMYTATCVCTCKCTLTC